MNICQQVFIKLFKDNNVIKIVTITAGKVADNIQRALMINYAKGMDKDTLKLKNKDSKNIKKI